MQSDSHRRSAKAFRRESRDFPSLQAGGRGSSFVRGHYQRINQVRQIFLRLTVYLWVAYSYCD